MHLYDTPVQVDGPMVHLTQKETSADLPVHWADHSLLLVRFWPLGTFAHPEIEAFCSCFFLELNSRPNQNRAGDASGPQQIKHNFVFLKRTEYYIFPYAQAIRSQTQLHNMHYFSCCKRCFFSPVPFSLRKKIDRPSPACDTSPFSS